MTTSRTTGAACVTATVWANVTLLEGDDVIDEGLLGAVVLDGESIGAGVVVSVEIIKASAAVPTAPGGLRFGVLWALAI